MTKDLPYPDEFLEVRVHSVDPLPGLTAGRSWIRGGGAGAWDYCSHGSGPRKDPCRPSTDQHGLSEWARGGCPDTGMQRSVRGSLIKGDITSPTTRYRGCGPCQAKRPGRVGNGKRAADVRPGGRSNSLPASPPVPDQAVQGEGGQDEGGGFGDVGVTDYDQIAAK